MYRARWISILLLLAVLLVGCSWPLSHPETEPLAAGKASSPVELSLARGEGRENGTPVASGSPATAPASPLTTPLTPVGSTPVVVSGRGEPFSGRTLRFTLPEGYRVLEGIDGGCFLYHESLPGFLVLYPQEGEPGEMLAGLLNATPGVDRSEPALEVDIGGLTFNGLFVETEAGSRLFLAASGGWTLVAQGPVDGWSTLAAGLNQVLLSLSFEEDF